MPTVPRFVRPCTAVWLLLVALTLVTFTVGELQLGGPGIVAFVLVTTLLKGQLVASWFMGLRHAPRLWGAIISGYLVVVGTAIAIAYGLGLE